MSEQLRVARYDTGVPCACGGYADRVDDADLTDEEVAQFNCGRGRVCCARAFVCRVCKTRFGARAEAPEMD